MSKGSGRRPRSITLEQFQENWERIFGSGTTDKDGDRAPAGQGGVSDLQRKVPRSGVQDSQASRASTRDYNG